MEGFHHPAPSPFDAPGLVAVRADDETLTNLYSPPLYFEEQTETGARLAPSDRLRIVFEEIGDRALMLAAQVTAVVAALRAEPPTFRRIDAFVIAVASGVLSVIGILGVIALFG